jgi:hypothetical protein
MDHGADNDRRIEQILVELKRLAAELEQQGARRRMRTI